MMVIRVIFAVLIPAVCMGILPAAAGAEEPYQLKQASVIKEVLFDHAGRKVSVRLDSGEELTGTVTKVGDHLVHVSRLSGRDFYDAVIRIDRVSAVIFRAREK